MTLPYNQRTTYRKIPLTDIRVIVNEALRLGRDLTMRSWRLFNRDQGGGPDGRGIPRTYSSDSGDINEIDDRPMSEASR